MQFIPDLYIKTWFRRCLFGLFFLSLSRILFIIYLFPYLKAAPLPELPLVLLSGVLFDIQAFVYFLLPFHLISILPLKPNWKYREPVLKSFFIFGLSLILLLNFIDLEFFKVKTRRSGIELFYLLGDNSNPVSSYIFNYWWLLLIFFAFVFLIFKYYPKAKTVEQSFSLSKAVFAFIFISGLLFIGARGSFSIKPLRSFDAARFVDPQWVSATINSPTQLITSYSSSVPKSLDYFTRQEALHIVDAKQTVHAAFKEKPNIVLIILESFGRDYCGYLNRQKRLTPFLDSLANLSISFPNAYSSGTTSMESMPAIFASLPSLLEVPYINSNYQNNTIYGMHHYLSEAGYDCSFYYGAENGSMGFDNFLKISGKINYFGKNEYPNAKADYDGHWGIWDQPYLKYYANELAHKKQPFFSSVFTLSSHDPYEIPDNYKSVFKEEVLPIYKAVRYTDNALRLYFKSVFQQPYFQNTIFIITADHPSHSTNEYFYTPTGKYEIPLLIFAPHYFKPMSIKNTTASHPDIMPTVMSMAGIKVPFFAFGKNLLDTNLYRTAINQDYGIPQLIDYPYCLRLYPNGKSKMHVQEKYTANADIRYVLTEEELIKKDAMEKILKAKLQVFNNSLLNNRWRPGN